MCAQCRISIEPVPITLQTAAVFLLAMILGPRVSGLATILYLACACLGLPVLSDGRHFADVGLLQAKTAGYVVGFIPASLVLGTLSARGHLHRIFPAWLAVFLMHGLVLLAGWAWLSCHIGARPAWIHGVRPFFIGAVLKSILVILITHILLPGIRRPVCPP